ncbi:PREDICTED: gamma-glutamylcyclotransferase [Nanorana parkeri]|uniref:gamma-glutamylcyclotransferase n=1 Tax=Nanorana parkeri TaxID=125878 RepID=UPI000854F69E|nr:PREDICTED: gamma-glutamylcyclotransferase [Nanorana parkeri]
MHTERMDMERKDSAGLLPGEDSFYYFAYGSNLLKERILLDNPSASFHSIALLKDFRLAFGSHKGAWNSRWHGGVATVVESQGDEVWGVVWRMDISSLDSLDIQEGVNGGVYQPIEIGVQTPDGELVCRCYQMNQCVYGPTSPQYKQVLCMGAKQNDLPLQYQKKLRELETNNYSGPIAIMDRLKEALQRVQDDG